MPPAGTEEVQLSLVDALQNLYSRQINVSIEKDWDDGYRVSIGNQRNGLDATEHFAVDELDSRAAEWLERKARELYLLHWSTGNKIERPDLPSDAAAALPQVPQA